uniref:Uncharacterized protein n=1 Tax=Anguilla anguilla TaxID=7936 RepID=A0A0E9TEI2_ANGAN
MAGTDHSGSWSKTRKYSLSTSKASCTVASCHINRLIS